MNGALSSYVIHTLQEIQQTIEALRFYELQDEAHRLRPEGRLEIVDELRPCLNFFVVSNKENLKQGKARDCWFVFYWYCIYAFLANCRKGACGCVQCWKSSVLSSFSNTEKVILMSFKLEGRQFQAAGPAWKNPRGPTVLVEVAGTNRSPDAGLSQHWISF